jgi:hypothetical protein
MRPSSFVSMLRWIGLVTVAVAVVGVQPAHATRQRAMVVTGFYATSRAEFDKRFASAAYVPVKYTSLPSGTTSIAAAWFWTGAAKSSTFFVVLRHHKGATINVAGPFTYKVTGGNSATYFPSPGAHFPDGAYDLDLVINYAFAATASVTIGGSGGGGTGGGGASGVTISTFVSTTTAGLNKWYKQPGLYPLPKVTTHYPAGTTETAFCFIYKGAVAKVSTYQVVVQGPNGLELKGNGPTKLTYPSGGGGAYRDPPQHLAYPNGSYTAVLQIDGSPASQVTFTIG